jgi:hypothetical protein
MRAEITLQDDTTTRYLRWEIVFEGGEVARLKALGGPLLLKLPTTSYVDDGGKFYESTEVEVPIYPHAGRRNQGQAKFTTYESRRAFLELLQQTVVGSAADFAASAAPGSVPITGHALTR